MDGAPTPVKDGEIANSGAAPKKLKFGMSVSSTDAGGDLPYAKRICKASGIKLSLGHSSKPGAEQDPVTAKEDTSLRIHVEDLSKGLCALSAASFATICSPRPGCGPPLVTARKLHRHTRAARGQAKSISQTKSDGFASAAVAH